MSQSPLLVHEQFPAGSATMCRMELAHGTKRKHTSGLESRAAALFPIPLFEQFGDGIAKARQEMLPAEFSTAPEELALIRGVADFDALGIGINDLDRQVGGAGKEPSCGRLESLAQQSFGTCRALRNRL